jgi:hypothetical protein
MTEIPNRPAVTYDEAERQYGGTLGSRQRFDELTHCDALVRAVAGLKARGEYDPDRHTADPGEPLTLSEYLEILAIGEVLARAYRHPAHVHAAVTAGATWAQVADATGCSEQDVRRAYRDWADGQHRIWRMYGGRFGLSDDEHAAAIARAGDLPDLRPAVMASNYDLTQAEISVMLDALSAAADYKRERVAGCPDCERTAESQCGTCSWRLAQADGYDALATKIGGAP